MTPDSIRAKIAERLERNGYHTSLYQYVRSAAEQQELDAMVREGLLERRAYRANKHGYPDDRGRNKRTCYIRPGCEGDVKRLKLVPQQ